MSEYKGDLERDLVIPFGRALIGGVLLGSGALTVAILAGWDNPWAWFVGVWAISTAFEWFRHSGRSLAILERWLQVDINRDGQIGDPVILEPYQPITRIEVLDAERRWGEWLDLPLEEERLLEISTALVEGADFSHASLAGARKPLSRGEYEALRDEYLRRGLVRWVNPHAHNQGLQLTAKGHAVTRGFASMAASDLPRLEG